MSVRFSGYLGVDVEDWFNMTILESAGQVIRPSEAVVRNTDRLLQVFAESGVTATFFFLGEVAEHYPALVRQAVEAGHEPAVHGYHHHSVAGLDRGEYRESLAKAKSAVEQAGGVRVLGYRAADFGINQSTWYALNIISEAGFEYDSSIFPFSGPRYGLGSAPREPNWIETESGKLLEIPVTVVEMLGIRFPAAGGGYLRHLPWIYTRLMLGRAHSLGQPIVFYLHPYEVEYPSSLPTLPGFLTPRQAAGVRREHRWQTRNRRHTAGKLKKLFGICEFREMRRLYEQEARRGEAGCRH